jgi:hypothetical protein
MQRGGKKIMYFAIANPLKSNRYLMPLSRLSELYSKEEVYRSLYGYPDVLLKDCQEPTHRYLIDYPHREVHDIIFDIDPQQDLKGQELLREGIRHLLEYGIKEEHIYPYFSGRGYHIHVPNVWGFEPEDIPEVVKYTVDGIIPFADNIYDKNRVVRLENTINKKTKIGKTSVEWFVDVEGEIFTPEIGIYDGYHFYEIPQVEPYLPKKHKPIVQIPVQISSTKAIPTRYTCIHKLWAKGAPTGMRHQTILRMASFYRYQDYTEQLTKQFIQLWMKDNPIPDMELDKLVHDTYHANNGSGYHYGCNDRILSNNCYSGCILNRMGIGRSESMENPTESLLNYLREPAIVDLKHILNLKEHFRIWKTDLISVLGEAGSCKTTLMVHLGVQMPEPIRWINLEDRAESILYKWVQMQVNLPEKELIQHLESGKDGFNINNIRITQMDNNKTLEKIEKEIMENVKENIIFIDHAGAIEQTSGINGYQWMLHLPAVLKSIAERYHKVIIVSTHKGRNSGMSNQMMDEQHTSAILYIDGNDGEKEKWIRHITLSTAKKVRKNLAFTKDIELDLKTMKVTV